MISRIELRTEPGESIINFTDRVADIIFRSGIEEGICVIFVPHTTAAVTINSSIDRSTLADIQDEVDRIVPTRVDFHHQYDTPRDASGHIKSVLIGNSISLIIHQGELILGGSQSLLFCEYDGPRNRQVIVRIMQDG